MNALRPLPIESIPATPSSDGQALALGLQRNLWACLLVNLLTLAVMLWSAARTRRPVTGRQDDLPDIDVRPA